MSKDISEKMQEEIASKIDDAFDTVIKQKKEYYLKNPSKIPNLAEVDSLVSSCALKNSAISGGSSLIPGPWGMAAVIPELVLVIRNQISLIYDIGAAYGKKDLMNKELMVSVFLYAMGSTAGGLLVVHGGKFFLKRATLRILQKLIAVLGGKITQQALKSAISKWFPGVGAAAMAAWSNYSTRQIGKKAREILSSDIEVEANEVKNVEPNLLIGKNNIDRQKSIDYFQIKILIAFCKINKEIKENQLEFINEKIKCSKIQPDEHNDLMDSIKDKSKNINIEGLDVIKLHPDIAISTFSNLISLSKLSDDLHIKEKLFIKQIGKKFDFSDKDIEDFLEAQI